MTNLVFSRNISLEDNEIIQVTFYKYLGHKIKIKARMSPESVNLVIADVEKEMKKGQVAEY